MAAFTWLAERGIVRITGEDRVGFLQGLTSNDVRLVAADRAIYSALLTPQGKYLHDFFVVASGDALLLDCEAARRDDLMRRLRMYRLRSKVELSDASSELVVAAAFGEGAASCFGLDDVPGAAAPAGDGVAYVDPRLTALGVRLALPRATAAAVIGEAGLTAADAASYDALRLELGAPDGSRDLEIEKSILLEGNLDALNAVSWTKGCYLGQELTARTKYRGLVKKRLAPVSVDGPLPAPGTPVLKDGREVGEIRSGREGRALALLRLDAQGDGGPLAAGDASITPTRPGWSAR